MGAKTEVFAKAYEAKVNEATAAIENISDADWKKVTSAEKWPVGVVAYHIAWGHEVIGGLVKATASSQSMPSLTHAGLNEMNAKNAQDWAGRGKAETVALHKKNAAATAALVRGLDDSTLAKSGTIISDAPPMSTEQLCGLLASHIDEHLGSIRATVGH